MHQVGKAFSKGVAENMREQYTGATTREDLYRALIEHNDEVEAEMARDRPERT